MWQRKRRRKLRMRGTHHFFLRAGIKVEKRERKRIARQKHNFLPPLWDTSTCSNGGKKRKVPSSSSKMQHFFAPHLETLIFNSHQFPAAEKIKVSSTCWKFRFHASRRKGEEEGRGISFDSSCETKERRPPFLNKTGTEYIRRTGRKCQSESQQTWPLIAT